MLAATKESGRCFSSTAFNTIDEVRMDGHHPGKKQRTIAVEGNIGSGKSTFLKFFNNDPNVQALTEPVALWKNVRGHNTLTLDVMYHMTKEEAFINAMFIVKDKKYSPACHSRAEGAADLMYKDARRWSLAFQSYVQLTMLDIHCNHQQERRVKLMERSIFSARFCFVENLYRGDLFPEVDYVILDEWFNWITENVDVSLDLIVYLRTSPEVCQERIKMRNNTEESGIPLDYLESLHKLHDDWLMKKSGFPPPCPVLVLDADQSLEELQRELEHYKPRIVSNVSI